MPVSDLFAFADRVAEARGEPPAASAVDAAQLDDAALIASLPAAGLRAAPLLAGEAARRRLAAAVPALERLCRRLTGFGSDAIVPEQRAALDALAAIGGSDVRETLVRLLAAQAFQGPTLAHALAIAARLDAVLPIASVRCLAGHADAAVRAAACRCAPAGRESFALLRDRLDDGDAAVRRAACCALGAMGRAEALPLLQLLLKTAPDAEIVAAVAPVANRDCLVLLGRIARTMPALAAVALAALEANDDPVAATIAVDVRRESSV
ncbi:MAG TPA: HEAT repeat domain-containing protein [Stellaceae bacterium]|nr:HEAT repeat domain-containing protein [Stellaceae bacterium]